MDNRYASKKSGQIINSLPVDLREKLDGIIAEFKENLKIYKRNPNYVGYKKALTVLIKEFERHCKRLDEIDVKYIDDHPFSLVDEGEKPGFYFSDDDGREDTHDVAPDETPGQLSKRLRMEAQSHLAYLKKTLAGLPIRERKPDISPAAMKKFATGVAEVFRLAGGNPTLPGHEERLPDRHPFLAFSKEAARRAGYHPHSDRAWADIIRPYLN
jgi:hypothetical protein